MSVFQLKTFGDLVRSIRNELGVQSTDTTANNRIKEIVNAVYSEIVSKKRWWWLNGSVDITLPAYTSAGTASVTQNSNVVTLSVAPASSKKGYYFALDGYSEVYRIDSHAQNSVTVRLSNTFTGSTNPTATYRIWTDKIALPTDCKETVEVSHDFYRQPMENVGRQEFNRLKRIAPRNEAKPVAYYTGDFADPTQLTSISGLPSVSTRSSNLMVKTIIFSNSIPLSIATSINAGEPVQWNISGASHPSYNGTIRVSSVSTTSILNDTITYTGLMEYTESATADSGLTITAVGQEQDYNRYRELFLYPALSNSPVTIHVEYTKEALPLNNDSDEPLLPIHDRIALRYGALAILWSSIGRNDEQSARNNALYDQKINQMESKWQDTTESATLRPNRNYLNAKRNILGRRGASIGGGPLISGGSGGGQTITGTANTAAIFGSDGVLVASPSISSTELGYLDGVTSNIQDQLNATTTLADGKIYIGNASNTATEVTPSGDVTISNAGVTAITAGVIVNNDISPLAGIDASKIAGGTVSSTEFEYLNGVTSSVQDQINTKAPIASPTFTGTVTVPVTASRALVTGASSQVAVSATTATEIGYVSGVTSAIQTQLDTKALDSDLDTHVADQAAHGATSANTASKIVARDASGNVTLNNVYGAGLDSPGVSGTVSIGATNATTINIGSPGATVNIQGSTTNIQATNTEVTDQLITLNNGGSAGSASGTGIEIEENAVITGYIKTSSDRNGFDFKAPNTAGVATLTTGASSSNIALVPSSGPVRSSGSALTTGNTNLASEVTGTLPIANGGTGQTGQTAAFDALAPTTTAGDLIVHNGTNNVRLAIGSDGQTIVADSSQTNKLKWATLPQGTKNYITAGTFESNSTSGWSLGNVSLTSNFPSGAPTFGSGAAANLSISTVSIGKLAGSYSLSLVSSNAATTAGNFLASDALTLDLEDQAKILGFKFYYSPTVNPSNGNFSGTSSNSFGVAIYDVTNSAWIQPAGVFNLVQSSGVGICQGTFQTPANMTSFRMVIYNANATAGAISLTLDDFYCGPQAIAFGPAMSDWVEYTPTFVNLGSTTNTKAYWRRVGDSIEIRGRTVAGTTGAGPMTLTLPSGINTVAQSYITTVGTLFAQSAGAIDRTFGINIPASSSNTLNMSIHYGGGYSQAAWGTDIANSSIVEFWAENIPISGWSSNTVQSADTDTRVVACRAYLTGSQAIANGATDLVLFNSVAAASGNGFDTHAAFNTSTGKYAVPVSGTYRITGQMSQTGNGAMTYKIYKNGTYYARLCQSGSGTPGGTGTGTVQAVAGDLLDVRGGNTSGGSLSVYGENGVDASAILIERLSGPATVQATESVNAFFTGAPPTGTLSAAYNAVTFATKVKDTHGSLSGSTYTIPVQGSYSIAALIAINCTASNGNVNLQITKNGSAIATTAITTTAASGISGFYPLVTVAAYPFNAGDTVQIKSYASVTSPTFNSNADQNYFSIARVGN